MVAAQFLNVAKSRTEDPRPTVYVALSLLELVLSRPSFCVIEAVNGDGGVRTLQERHSAQSGCSACSLFSLLRPKRQLTHRSVLTD